MKSIILIISIVLTSLTLHAKTMTPEAVVSKVKEAIKVGKSMEGMDTQICLPLMKSLQPEMRDISQKVLGIELSEEKSSHLYEATIGATYCVKCLRVSAMKNCKKAEEALNNYKKAK